MPHVAQLAGTNGLAMVQVVDDQNFGVFQIVVVLQPELLDRAEPASECKVVRTVNVQPLQGDDLPVVHQGLQPGDVVVRRLSRVEPSQGGTECREEFLELHRLLQDGGEESAGD